MTSIVPFFALWALMWFTLRYGYVYTLLLAVPTAGFMLRIFMVQHDCGHGTLFKSRVANDCLGFWLGVLTLTPYYHWRRSHSLHHASSGNLDRRGHGYIYTLTVEEYLALPLLRRIGYRILRHPLFLFGLAPLLQFVVLQRFPSHDSLNWPKERANVHITNLCVVLLFGGVWFLVGLRSLLLIELPITLIAASIGVWLFFVQHHFEETYLERQEKWDYEAAGVEGSSYYALPRVLQWFTANIGFHHIHHLDSRIPNYRLEECFKENPCMQKVKTLTFGQSFSCASLALWDEKSQTMVGFDRAVLVEQ
ncbi:MAG TPA: fatty acid desaturase [Candidatus Angelobacter sp.]